MGHEGPERDWKFSSTFSLTLALDGGECLKPLWHLTLEKESRDTLHKRQGGLQGRSGRVRKISPPPGFEPRTDQPVPI
jgi:hypothetical protein